MRVLPDTSIWVAYLRDGQGEAAGRLDRLLLRETVLLCGPVLAELVAGTAEEEREALELAVGSLPWADLDRGGWGDAGQTAHRLRRAGRSLPLTDVLIAVAAARAQAAVWTRDRDFERIREVLPELELYEPR